MRRLNVRNTQQPEPAGDDMTMSGHQEHSVFLRGLSLGALIGAAIAGSTIWGSRRARRERADEAAAASKSKDAGNT